jgi:hypothetical protein
MPDHLSRHDYLALSLRCATTRWLVEVQEAYRLRCPKALSNGIFDSGMPYGLTQRLLEAELTRRGVSFTPTAS